MISVSSPNRIPSLHTVSVRVAQVFVVPCAAGVYPRTVTYRALRERQSGVARSDSRNFHLNVLCHGVFRAAKTGHDGDQTNLGRVYPALFGKKTPPPRCGFVRAWRVSLGKRVAHVAVQNLFCGDVDGRSTARTTKDMGDCLFRIDQEPPDAVWWQA